MSNTTSSPARQLLQTLFIELFQTEKSCLTQCAREVERHNVFGPALAAMAACSDDGGENLRALEQLAAERHMTTTAAGKGLGTLFSAVREFIADRAMPAERSWRLTLVGLRHGIDVYVAVREVARVEGDPALVRFCDEALARRQPLVERVAAGIAWFASRPDIAMRRAAPGMKSAAAFATAR